MAKGTEEVNKWTSPEHVSEYFATMAEKLPHNEEIKTVFLEQIPSGVNRVLDLGTGDGRLLSLVKLKNPNAECIGVDFSEPMLKLAKKRFENDNHVKIFEHDLDVPLPAELGCFDIVVSGLAIHHLNHNRKRQLYQEIFDSLNSKGMFCNLEHVASPTESLHHKFLVAVGLTSETDDPSNKLIDIETQLRWFREIGFYDVDCYWKWLEVALLVGLKP